MGIEGSEQVNCVGFQLVPRNAKLLLSTHALSMMQFRTLLSSLA